MKDPCRLLLLSFLLTGIVISGCVQKPPGEKLSEERTIAVAGFSQPQQPWEMLAGYPSGDETEVSREVLKSLDRILSEQLLEEKISPFLGSKQTQQCEEIILSELQGSRISALEYWVRVGRCMPADYVLVPQLMHWKEREGSEWGVQSPAEVVLNLFLVDAKNGRLADRFYFEERQKSLSENILTAPKFLKRGGKWVSAEELAGDGIEQGIKELGL